MTMTDPIADMLTRIRNAVLIKSREVQIPSSKMKIEIAKILKDEGYIKNFRVLEGNVQGVLNILLKYAEGSESVISGLKRVSKPGCRIYCKADSIPKVLDGLGIIIISTSKGVATGRKCEELGIGGEVLCQIW
ncbi:MAG: 30S ribosomal protein S8 [Candidatus Aminicenantes bacterium]|nr:30S ribosomal protein S8 [Candidatus Aminicenantes bacterium]